MTSGLEKRARLNSSAVGCGEMIPGLIDGNAINPRLKVCIAAKVANALKRSQKGFLCQVARLFTVFR